MTERSTRFVLQHPLVTFTARSLTELQTVKQELYKLEGMQPGTEEFDSLLNRMMASLHHHNDDEEIDDLPLLEPAIGEDASKEAAQSFKQTKKFVPTRYVRAAYMLTLHEGCLMLRNGRAHPSAPNKPPFETLVGFLAAPVDKLLDAFAAFPKEEEMDEAKEELKHRDHDAAAGRVKDNQ